jgi:putative oxidoreductase
MKRLTSTTPLDTDLAILILRIIFGGMFIYHGWPKLANYSDMVAMFNDPISIGNEASVALVVFAEVFCGLFILLGFLTRFSVIPVFITMLVAYFVAHGADPFTNKMLPFVYLFLCVVIFILGSGRYSLDTVLFNRNKTNQ